MKIYTTMAFFAEEQTGNIYQVDTIEYQGKFWLVPQWLESPSEKWRMPARIICLETLQHQQTLGSPFGDFVLNVPISRDVFDGRKSEPGYVVIDRPNIRFDIPPLH